MLGYAFCAMVALIILGSLPYGLAAESYLIPEKGLDFRIDEGGETSKSLEIHGLSNNTEVRFFSSKLTSKDSPYELGSENIRFNRLPTLKIKLDEGEVQDVLISAQSDQTGVFGGDILVQSAQNSSIQRLPISLEVRPIIPYDIILFFVGFGISYALWSWKRSQDLRERFKDIQDQAWQIERNFYAFTGFIKEHYSYLIMHGLNYKDVVEAIKLFNIKSAEQRMKELSQAFSNLVDRSNFDESKLMEAASALRTTPDDYVSIIVTKVTSPPRREFGRPFSADISEIQDAKFSYLKYLWKKKYVLLFDAGAIMIGLLIGLGSLFQQQQGAYYLDAYNVIIFLALGGGADSLKQIIEKVIFRET